MKIGLAAATAATVIGPAAGVAPPSAAPAQTPVANLFVFVDPASSGNYRVTVKGVIAMDEYSAHGYINNLTTGKIPGGIEYVLLGDDPDVNDHTGSPLVPRRRHPPSGTASDQGIHSRAAIHRTCRRVEAAEPIGSYRSRSFLGLRLFSAPRRRRSTPCSFTRWFTPDGAQLCTLRTVGVTPMRSPQQPPVEMQ